MGNLEVVRLLIEEGAEIDHLVSGETSLIHSLHWSHWNIASLLIKSGASLQTSYPPKMPPEENIILKVISKGFPVAAALDFLIESGASSNTQNQDSQTPLHVLFHTRRCFSKDDFVSILKCLLRHGADPNSREKTASYCMDRLSISLF